MVADEEQLATREALHEPLAVVLGVSEMRGHGPGAQMVVVQLNGPEPAAPSYMRRLSDGVTWHILGVRPERGDTVGLFVRGAVVREGDVVEFDKLEERARW